MKAYVLHRMKGEPVVLDISDADILILQFQETARIRKWKLHAASVMFNHVHIVVSVLGDPEPESILETLKSWATRALKKIKDLPPHGTFWTAKGSKRKLEGGQAVQAAVVYVVKKQPNPLAVYFAPEWQESLDSIVGT